MKNCFAPNPKDVFVYMISLYAIKRHAFRTSLQAHVSLLPNTLHLNRTNGFFLQLDFGNHPTVIVFRDLYLKNYTQLQYFNTTKLRFCLTRMLNCKQFGL